MRGDVMLRFGEGITTVGRFAEGLAHAGEHGVARDAIAGNAIWHALRVSKKGITVTGYRRRRFEARAHIGSSITFD